MTFFSKVRILLQLGKIKCSNVVRSPSAKQCRLLMYLLTPASCMSYATNGTTQTARTNDISHLKSKQYHFENIVFEGGGARGHSYTGVIKFLDDLEIYPQFRRFCGVSAGSIVATLMAIGCSPTEIDCFMRKLTKKVFLDSSLPALPYNLFKYYGWHPAKKFKELLSEEIRKKHGNARLTFGELYKKKQVELCIVGSSISSARVEYFHPKTAWNLPIVDAVAMSIAIPVVMEPGMFTVNGRKECIVDGGLLNNFPINCFDGWYLSMNPDDSFIHSKNMEKDFHSWFEGYNRKTLGVLVYGAGDREVFKRDFELRFGETERRDDDMPDTKLARKKKGELPEAEMKQRQLHKKMAAAKTLVDALSVIRENRNQTNLLTMQEFLQAIKSLKHPEDYERLFGKRSPEDMFAEISGKDNEMNIHELAAYLSLHHYSVPRISEPKIKHTDFLKAMLQSVLFRHKALVVRKQDVQRVIGINCGYVDMLADVEDEDIEYLQQKGYRAARDFFEELHKKGKMN